MTPEEVLHNATAADTDLHMHSVLSDDGEFAPAALARMAAKAGLRTIALCDHNIAAGNAEFLAAAQEEGLTALPGIELDCCLNGAWLHLLGYGIDFRDPRYAALREDIDRKRAAASPVRVAKIRALGIVVDDARLAARAPADGIPTGETVGEAALEDPANEDNPLLLPFREGGTRATNPLVSFYWDFCSPGKPAYAHIEYMTLAEAVHLVTSTGGMPVLAHPAQSLRGKENLLDAVAACGIRGIEVHSSYHTPEDTAYWIREAERLALVPTRGSDFHGKIKPAITLGTAQ